MTIKTKPVEYMHGKTKCVGYMAWNDSYADPKPCVLINHAWRGLDGFVQDKAINMAANGYVGFCLDNYGDGALHEAQDDCAAAMGVYMDDRKLLQERLKAGLKAACAQDEVDASHVAAMGFCFGGLCTLDMARAGFDIKAAISFHGLLAPSGLPAKKIKSKVLIAHGWDDPMAPPSDVVAIGEEMAKAKCDWRLQAYGLTSHAFTNPEATGETEGMQYNPDTERRSWNATLELLDEVFGHHGVKAA